MDQYLTKRETRDLWNFICQESTSFWETSPLYPHAGELLSAAAAQADLLYFITSRAGRYVQDQTHRVLTNKFPFVARGAIICTPSAEAKIPIVRALNLSHYVDDKKETVELANQHCFYTDVACWTQPWNKVHQFPASVTRMNSVEEFQKWLSTN